MDGKKNLPRLRHVDATPVSVEGRQMICLTDGLKLVESQVLVSPAMMLILMHFDGEHAAIDAQESFMRKFGVLLPSAKIEELAEALDKALFLDNERFKAHYKSMVEAFKAAHERPPSHAGLSYESDPAALRSWMDGLFAAAPATECGRGGPARGLIVPHYDLRHAGPAFAAAYSEARAMGRPDAAVVLGTGHLSLEGSLFTATDKDFATPLGTVETCKDAVRKLAEGSGQDLFAEEFLHAKEHSIEFQALFLRYAFPGVPMVPVLVSNFHQFIGSQVGPFEDSRVSGFITALGDALAGMKTLFIASVDFAHVGLRFGDADAAEDSNLGPVEEFDRKLLKLIESCDADGFFTAIDQNRDATRICGFPAICTLLKLLRGSKGTTLKYEKNVDPTGSAVTYASVIFTDFRAGEGEKGAKINPSVA